MAGLRQDFRNWLVGQGISDKLINGKSSSVYEYVRQLDILSKRLFNSEDWDLLVRNAKTLVFFYLLCGKSKYRNNNVAFNELEQYLTQNACTEIPSRILTVFQRYKADEVVLSQTLNNKAFNEKAGVSFLKFYQFLDEEKKLCDFSLQDIKRAVKQILKICTKLKLEPIKGDFPAQIKTSATNSSRSVTVEELITFLGCSRSTIERLLKKGLFKLTIDSVNAFLEKHYHPSKITKLYSQDLLHDSQDLLHEKWYTVAEASDFVGCSETKIKQLLKQRLLSYTDYSARKIRISGNDLIFFKKINK